MVLSASEIKKIEEIKNHATTGLEVVQRVDMGTKSVGYILYDWYNQRSIFVSREKFIELLSRSKNIEKTIDSSSYPIEYRNELASQIITNADIVGGQVTGKNGTKLSELPKIQMSTTDSFLFVPSTRSISIEENAEAQAKDVLNRFLKDFDDMNLRNILIDRNESPIIVTIDADNKLRVTGSRIKFTVKSKLWLPLNKNTGKKPYVVCNYDNRVQIKIRYENREMFISTNQPGGILGDIKYADYEVSEKHNEVKRYLEAVLNGKMLLINENGVRAIDELKEAVINTGRAEQIGYKTFNERDNFQHDPYGVPGINEEELSVRDGFTVGGSRYNIKVYEKRVPNMYKSLIVESNTYGKTTLFKEVSFIDYLEHWDNQLFHLKDNILREIILSNIDELAKAYGEDNIKQSEHQEKEKKLSKLGLVGKFLVGKSKK